MKTSLQQGFAIVATLLVVAIIGVMVAGSLWLSSLNRQISSNDAVTTQVVNVAQAGNAYWKAELVSLYKYMMDNFPKYDTAITNYVNNGGNISCGNYFAIGLDLDRNGTIDQTNGSTLPNVSIPAGSQTGTVSTRFDVVGSSIKLTAQGRLGSSKATVVDEFNISSADIWNNAVFSDDGSSNGTVSGRAEIRGAVHILGENPPSNNIVLDITGTFGLGNTYRQLNPSLGVTASELRLSNGDPQDLCAVLRVRKGDIKMNQGNPQLGYAENTNADPFVDNLQGIYTNGQILGGVENSNIFSKNGMSAKYDSGDTYKFPMLNDTIPNSSPITTWAQKLRNNSLVLSGLSLTDVGGNNASAANKADIDDRNVLPTVAANGTVTWPSGVTGTLSTNSYYLSPNCLTTTPFGVAASAGTSTTSGNGNGNGNGNNNSGSTSPQFTLVMGSTPAFNCIKYKVKGASPAPATDEVVTEVTWNSTDSELYIGGISAVVTLVGRDLSFSGGNGSNAEIEYKGNGVLFVERRSGTTATTGNGGNIQLAIDVVPGDGKAALEDTRGARSSDSTRYNVSNNGSQKRATLAIYAEQTIKINKQALIAGSLVSQVFDMTTQVPTVLYVPNLAQRLSRFMPGAGGNGYVVSNVAWSRQ
jgi:type II secretory pathway pseudopilin PulG